MLCSSSFFRIVCHTHCSPLFHCPLPSPTTSLIPCSSLFLHNGHSRLCMCKCRVDSGKTSALNEHNGWCRLIVSCLSCMLWVITPFRCSWLFRAFDSTIHTTHECMNLVDYCYRLGHALLSKRILGSVAFVCYDSNCSFYVCRLLILRLKHSFFNWTELSVENHREALAFIVRRIDDYNAAFIGAMRSKDSMLYSENWQNVRSIVCYIRAYDGWQNQRMLWLDASIQYRKR